MFKEKNILWIDQFDFEDGKGDPRDKYLIVLFETGSDTILAPLTTSVDYVPDKYKTQRCIKDDSSNIHCYFIPKQEIIGEGDFFFKKDTFIHISPANIKNRYVSSLVLQYELPDRVYLKDILTEEEYCNLLYCLYKSKHVPRGLKPQLETRIKQLVEKQQDSQG